MEERGQQEKSLSIEKQAPEDKVRAEDKITPEEKSIQEKVAKVAGVRAECRQFAMLYYHLCNVLVAEQGIARAKESVRKIIYNLSIDRTSQLRERAQQLGLPCTLETFTRINDLPSEGWIPELGRNHCPYAECWVQYYERSPWFREFAPYYCDIIDTTNIEHFSRTLTHRITRNVLKGDPACERIYEESDRVKKGQYTYGEQAEKA